MSNQKQRVLRATYDLTGVVQGVGFRPALFRLATEAGLGGSVQNRSGVVRLILEGRERDIRDFVAALPRCIAPPARLDGITPVGAPEPLAAAPASRFVIDESLDAGPVEVTIPADLAVCNDCRREMFTPGDRRHGYAFTTCTACGPRYTVVTAMPYDRERTSMRRFPLCPLCRGEYEDPSNRRFHAESTACPACGPRLALMAPDGAALGGDPLRQARAALRDGRIVAVKGIGGFLLAADARNRDTLVRLRQRKQRPHKPLAVMARDLAVAVSLCDVPPEARAALVSPERPIVILDVAGHARGPRAARERNAGCAREPNAGCARNGRTEDGSCDGSGLPMDLIGPDTDTLGVMLPTSPLHELLFTPLDGDPTPAFDWLIMTSGNRRGEPICLGDDEALDRLRDIADLLLTHDRAIVLRNDDSIATVRRGGMQLWRRARGYAPAPVAVSPPLRRNVLAMGAEIKNAVALGYGDRIVLSPHIGDLETPEALRGFEQVVACLPAFLERRPEAIAVDLHPDMHATRAGLRRARELGIPAVPVQHHHAHAAACLAENGEPSGLALVFDGTGLGTDGSVWGAELLHVTPDGFRRLGTFEPAALPGGDAAVLEPARQAVARWDALGIAVGDAWLDRLHVTARQVELWTQLLRRRLNCPLSHAAGRVFDAFAAVLGLAPARITYEGQAAIRLEAAARRATAGDEALPFATRVQDGMLRVDWGPAFALLADPAAVAGREARYAMAAHRAVAKSCTELVAFGVDCVGEQPVALSGGVFMNRILSETVVAALERSKLRVLTHRCTPPNDGCIALGQAVIAGR